MVIDSSKNFWDLNPEFLDIEVFKRLFDELGKRRSSNVMWCIHKVYYPSSPIYTLFETEEERIKEVHKTPCLEFIPDFKEHKELIKAFQKLLPQGLKFLRNWEEVLRDLDKEMDDASFKKSIKDRVTWLTARPELLRQYKEALASWTEELNGKSANKGGYQESKGVESGELLDFG